MGSRLCDSLSSNVLVPALRFRVDVLVSLVLLCVLAYSVGRDSLEGVVLTVSPAYQAHEPDAAIAAHYGRGATEVTF